jgi:lipopolysaccharide heptosyltransferase II
VASTTTAESGPRDAPPAAAGRLAPAPGRILVKEVNWLGDLVMSLPALRAIRRAWPQAHLAVLIKRELAGFFAGAAWLDEVIPYAVGSGFSGIADRARIVTGLRRRGFDLAVLFPSSFESALWATMAGIPRRAGFSADARGALLTLKCRLAPEATAGHQVNWWLSMVRATVGAEGDPGDFALEPHAESVAKMRAWIAARRRRPDRPLIALAPGAAFGPAKQWPTKHYSELIDLVAAQTSAECVLIGAPDERAKCEEVAAGSHAGALIAAGETGIAELIALLALADGFAGNDSGSMHIAGALGRPTVAIFGSTDPARTGPLGSRTRVIWRHLECSPCLARTCRFGHYDCLREITPAAVAAALAESAALGSGGVAVGAPPRF